MPSKLRPLWRCPKCGKKFVTENMWHSCTRRDLKTLFAKSEPHVYRLYRKFKRMVRACGPVMINVRTDGISFQARVRAIGCKPYKSYLRIGFAFLQRRRHPRFVKVHSFSPTWHAHWIRVYSEKELDEEVAQWIREAYERSAQKHLEK